MVKLNNFHLKCPDFCLYSNLILFALKAKIFEGSVIAQNNHLSRVTGQQIRSITKAGPFNTRLLPLRPMVVFKAFTMDDW
jgi:hypothetical protein